MCLYVSRIFKGTNICHEPKNAADWHRLPHERTRVIVALPPSSTYNTKIIFKTYYTSRVLNITAHQNYRKRKRFLFFVFSPPSLIIIFGSEYSVRMTSSIFKSATNVFKEERKNEIYECYLIYISRGKLA